MVVGRGASIPRRPRQSASSAHDTASCITPANTHTYRVTNDVKQALYRGYSKTTEIEEDRRTPGTQILEQDRQALLKASDLSLFDYNVCSVVQQLVYQTPCQARS